VGVAGIQCVQMGSNGKTENPLLFVEKSVTVRRKTIAR